MNLLPARPSSRLAALVVCCLLGISACDDDQGAGGGDDDGNELAANARAAAVNVQLTDLPEGYVAIPAPEGEQVDNPALDDCVEDMGEFTVADAESPTYRLQSDAGIDFVASETSVLSEPEPAARVLASVTDQPVLDCLSRDLGEVLASILPGATTETPLTLTPDPDFPDVGGESVRLEGSATFARPGAGPVTLTASLVFLHTDEVLSVVLFGGIGEPFPPETLRALTSAVADRQSAERQS